MIRILPHLTINRSDVNSKKRSFTKPYSLCKKMLPRIVLDLLMILIDLRHFSYRCPYLYRTVIDFHNCVAPFDVTAVFLVFLVVNILQTFNFFLTNMIPMIEQDKLITVRRTAYLSIYLNESIKVKC